MSSPLGSLTNGSRSSTFCLINSSYNFEISLQNNIFLPLKLVFKSGITLLIFLGEIKNTIESANFESFFSSFNKFCFLSGKNP